WGNDDDIDLICDSLKKFVSSSNAIKRGSGISAYQTVVQGQKIPLDIRYIGDQYYDPNWENDMLNRMIYKESYVPILRDDDYFFSLLYHAKIQKREVKSEYVPRLIQLSEKIGFNGMTE